MSGVNRTPATRASATGSSQTVCQMPVTGVYQMPSGLLTCLPRGCASASVGSHTRTTSSPLPSFSASVTSTENGSLPPRCVTSSFPFTQTVASQSTAPKCRRPRSPFHAAGTSTARRYQRFWPFVTCLPTPLSALSVPNGTRIWPSHFSGRAAHLGMMA